MKDHKNIERLFQEKFKDFEAIPPQESWNIIASRINEKKKKKVFHVSRASHHRFRIVNSKTFVFHDFSKAEK